MEKLNANGVIIDFCIIVFIYLHILVTVSEKISFHKNLLMV